MSYVRGCGQLCIAEWLVVEGVCSYGEGKSLVVYRGVVSCIGITVNCYVGVVKYKGNG